MGPVAAAAIHFTLPGALLQAVRGGIHFALLASALSVLLLCGLATDPRALGPTPRPLDPVPPLGPSEPAPSPDGATVAFSWAGDLWTVSIQGGLVSRLTEGPGEDVRPVWSPDGGWIAFARREEERWNVWTLDLESGREFQLTRHDAAEFPSGFSPDGAHVLFHGARDGEERVHQVPTSGGPVELLVDVPSSEGIELADGSLVFVRSEHPWWRRGGRGAGGADLWLQSPSGQLRRLTAFAGPELWPRVGGAERSIYYVSEESFQRNVWKLDPRGGAREQITAHRDAPVLFPRVSRNGRWLVYEQGGRLWRLDLAEEDGSPEQIDVRLPPSREEPVRRVYTNGARRLTVSGERLWLEIEGDVFVGELPPVGAVSAGDTLELAPVDDTGFREEGVALSPSGTFAVAVSDRSGGRDLYRVETGDAREARWQPFRQDRSELQMPLVSPDGRFVAYVRHFEGAELRLAESGGGRDVELAHAVAISDLAFSPDGRWIAFSADDEYGNADIYLASLFENGVYDVTLHPARDLRPRWSSDGRWLLYLSDRAGSFDLWGVPLASGRSASASALPADALLSVDLSGIALRSVQLTQLFGDEEDYLVAGDGSIAFLGTALGRRDLFVLPEIGAEPALLTLGLDLEDIAWSPSGFWLLDRAGRLLRLPVESSVPGLASGGPRVPDPVPYRAATAHDPAEERLQVLRQVWTELRDGFYQETLHLANWKAIRERMEVRVGEVRTRAELERLLLEMAGELDASHLGVSTPSPRSPAGRWGLSLRADGGRLRVTEVLPGGPADELGLAPGDRLFAVGGVPVDARRALEVAVPVAAWVRSEWIWEDRSGNERRATARSVNAARIRQLRFDAAERVRKEEVRRRSAGRIGYVSLPTIDREALDRLRREAELFQADADGLVLDLRENVGGDLPEEFLRQLDRRPLLQRQPRGQSRRGAPLPFWERPMVVLIGSRTGSAAEIVAQGLGVSGRAILVGGPTLGAVIGADEIVLQMGLRFRIPRIGWYTLQGENLEGRGVFPDIVVDGGVAGGVDDPVLDRALEVLRDEIRAKK